MNDRHRIELSIPASIAYMAYDGLLACAYKNGGEATEEEKYTLALLQTASFEPFQGLHSKDFIKLTRRAHRAAHLVMDDYKGAAVGKVFPMLVELTNELQDMGKITVADGGPYADAIDAIVNALNEAFSKDNDRNNEVDRMLKSASKQVPKIIAKLQGAGYYQ